MDGYIYIYVSPLSIYDTLAIQITFAPYITFVEVLEESKKKEPTIKPKINKDMFDEIFEDFGSFLKRKGFFEM